MQKTLVTGANGFVGSLVVKKLLAKGLEVVATGRGDRRFTAAPKINYKSFDYTDAASVVTVFEKEKPDVVVHCGAMSSADECELNRQGAFLNNVTGTIQLLKQAAAHQSHFIFLSTDFVFDGKSGMYKEEAVREPVNYYGETKVLAEDEVMQYEFLWTIVRTVLVYGKSDGVRDNIVTSTVKNLIENKPLKIFVDQLRTPTYVEDLVDGIIRIIDKQAGGIFHLGGPDKKTVYDVAIEAAKFNGLNASLIQPINEGDFVQAAKRPLITGLNIDKAKAFLDYQPVAFEEGLKRTFA